MFKKATIVCSSFFVILVFPFIVNADIIHLAPADFHPQDADEGNWYIYTGYQDYMYVETTATGYRYAYSRCLDLPHLATFDQVRIYYQDDSTASLYIRLVRQKVSDWTEETLASFQTSGTASFVREEDLETFTYPTIKTKGYRYFFRVYWSGAVGADLRLYGIRVRYYGGN